ncbi:MAG: phosphoribosyltransferase, partial [Candidatus Heimdallarchaeota archaeon]|nr:phosphoribosyltransferase [Candidatus Heimdallarchaeota archaeon]
MEENYLVLTFDEIWEKLFVLAKKIRKDPFEPNLIIGILRGGLAISRILSDLLSINEVTTIGVGFYKGINEREKSPFLTEE